MNALAFRLAFAQGASGLVGGVATPFFGAWLAWKGLSPQQIGLLLSAGMLLRVVVVPLTGIGADARNDRRGMMLALYAIALLGYGALNAVSWPVMIFLAAVPASVAVGATSPLLESVCVRLAHRFGFDYGHVRLFASSAFVFGNVVSVVLNLVAVYALPAPPAGEANGTLAARVRDTWAQARELMRSPVFLIFLAASGLDQGSHAFYYAYGGLHWRALGYSGALIGIIWPLGVLAEIAFLSMSRTLLRRVGTVRLLVLGGASCVLRWTILAFDPPLPWVIVAQILHGGSFALAHLGAMYFVLQAVPPRLAATAQSLYTVCAYGLAMGLATYASGPLYAAFGGEAYLLMSAMGVGATGFALWLGMAWAGDRVTLHAPEEELETI